MKEEILESAAQPDKRIIASDFDVFLDQNHLIYTKEHCSPTDIKARFFLHIIPVDRRDLYRKDDHKRGFQTMRAGSIWRGFTIGRHGCAARMKLSHYPVRAIRTGQYVPTEGRRLWESAAWIDPHSAGEESPAFPMREPAGNRIVQSDFDVYLDGRQLVYHKAACSSVDKAAPFFLQVTPTDATVLPPDRRQAGFDSLDVNSCTTEKWLPVYAIRHIRTGQFVRGEKGPLWKVDFSLNHASGSRGGRKLCGSPRDRPVGLRCGS